LDINKLQNDDNYLHAFIKDKYERKKYARNDRNPFSLILEGKEPEKREELVQKY
jgi:hypothetical protein